MQLFENKTSTIFIGQEEKEEEKMKHDMLPTALLAEQSAVEKNNTTTIKWPSQLSLTSLPALSLAKNVSVEQVDV